MDKTAATVPEEQRFILTRVSPSRRQKRLALAVVLALLLVALTVEPVSRIQLARIDAIVPAYAMAMFVNDSITAFLLFAQFSILRSRALLTIASGYVFTALIVMAWMLNFPGLFVPTTLVGGGLQRTAWLYMLWHTGFPMFVIAYALLKDADPAKELWHGSAGAAVLAGIAATATAVCAATFFIIAADALLPHLMIDAIQINPLWDYVLGFSVALNVLALVVLWVRRRSVLDLWLMVVTFAYIIELLLNPTSRFSVGWYVSRLCGVLSASLVLVVLLYEITFLYAQLLRAVFAQRREREARLMTGDAVAAAIAHEVRQPLSAMITNAETAVRWLDRSMPNLDKATAALKRIAVDGHRAGAVIGGIRTMFKTNARHRTSFDINELIKEVIFTVSSDLQKHRISVQTDPNLRMRQVIGDRIQLQQVLLNLIANAIDSMASEDEPRILSVKSEVVDSGIMIAVADSGKGIASQDVDRIFNPLFTTKPDGMGMGLSICRSIIEAHEGQLWFVGNTPRGTVFQFVLPIAAT